MCLLNYSVNPKMILWIIDFLVGRSQSVRYQSAMSKSRQTSTGAPQGTVLSPVLFTLYTNDCVGSENSPVIKYSDDSAIVDISNSDLEYFSSVQKFSDWCKVNYLDLNVKKTKELLIDFRTNPLPVPDLLIDGTIVERVDEYKYLGTIIDKKLDFSANTDHINKRCQSRIYCLQKLRRINVRPEILQTFYKSFIESVLTFGFMCWYGGLMLKNRKVLERNVKICSKIVGQRQVDLNILYERRVKEKAMKIISDNSHILVQYFELLPSGKRYRVPKGRSQRFKNSFVPKSINLLN